MSVDLADVMTLAGLVLVGVGCWLYWPPLALIVVGSILVGLGVLATVLRSRA